MRVEPGVDDSIEAAKGTLRRCARQDFRCSTSGQRVLLVGTVAWLVYEWGFGNETVTPWLLVRVVASSDGVWSVIATGLVGFGFTAGQQLASGFTTAAGFSMFRRTSIAAWSVLQKRLASAPLEWSRLSIPARSLVVFGLGTTAVVLIEMSLTGEVGVRRHRRTVVQAATLCGVLVGAVGALVAAVVWLGRSVPALQETTELIVRVLGNPLFWVGVLGAIVASSATRRRFSARRT